MWSPTPSFIPQVSRSPEGGGVTERPRPPLELICPTLGDGVRIQSVVVLWTHCCSKAGSYPGWRPYFPSYYSLSEPDFPHLQSGTLFLSTLSVVMRLKEYPDEG